MNRELIERIKQHTDQHVRDPQPGDHFTEHCGSVAFIEERDGDRVLVAKTNIVYGRKGWGQPQWMTVGEFVKWASYGTIPGYWLELFPPQFPDQLLEGG